MHCFILIFCVRVIMLPDVVGFIDPHFLCCYLKSETWTKNRVNGQLPSASEITDEEDIELIGCTSLHTHDWTATRRRAPMAWDFGHLPCACTQALTHTHRQDDPCTANLLDRTHTVPWPVFTPPAVMSLSVKSSVIQTCRCSHNTHSSSLSLCHCHHLCVSKSWLIFVLLFFFVFLQHCSSNTTSSSFLYWFMFIKKQAEWILSTQHGAHPFTLPCNTTSAYLPHKHQLQCNTHKLHYIFTQIQRS